MLAKIGIISLLLMFVPGIFCTNNRNIPSVEPQFLDMLRSTGQYREFGKYLKIDDIRLLQPGKDGEDSDEDEIFNEGVEFGDMILTSDQLRQGYTGVNFTKFPASRWKNGEVPYYISLTDYSAKERSEIERYIADFNSKVDYIKLRPRTPFFDRDYVFIFSGSGCFAQLGRVGGQQVLSLRMNRCIKSRVIEHEFMHALGVVHEQNRPDRDEYIEMLFDNISDDYKSQYLKVEEPDFEKIGNYDYYSIMHYPVLAPLTRKPAFRVLQSGINETRIGKGDGVTDQDIEKLNYYYNPSRSTF